ncbi:helix-turn-helix domain-containing protein [Actinoalloteichus hymeniacidonis]|nr:helix-turn-helix transcriptional regulator [Actinoalloteichus hymeniacidonis]
MGRPRSAQLRTPGARSLGAAVKAARTAAGHSTRALGRRLGKSAAWVLMLERGEVVFTPELVTAVANALELPTPEREALARRADDIGMSPWTPSTDLPGQLTTLVGYEREAVQINEITRIIPGLLQTEQYARAMISTSERYDQDDLVRIRMERQQVLTCSTAPFYLVILDESALQRPIAGHEAMAKQMAHLATMAELSNVDVRVIPNSAGVYPGMSAQFTVLEFEDSDPVVYVELLATATWLDKPNDTAPYAPALKRLRSQAMSSAESVNLMISYQRYHERKAAE